MAATLHHPKSGGTTCGTVGLPTGSSPWPDYYGSGAGVGTCPLRGDGENETPFISPSPDWGGWDSLLIFGHYC